MRQIHVMHVMHSFDIGGIEQALAEEVNGMNSDEFRHSICVFSPQFEAMSKIRSDRKLETFIIKRRFRNDPSVLFRLVRLMRKERPDVVHTRNWGGAEGILAAVLAGVRGIIHAEHGFDYEEIEERARKKRRIFARRFLLKMCKKVVVVSKNVQNWLIETVKVDAGKLIRIHNGCDLMKFHPGREPEKRKELGIRETDIVIGTVGRLKALKNPEASLRAFSDLALSEPRLKLMFVGDGPQKGELIAKAREKNVLDRVIFTGNMKDLAPYYRVMDLFVLSSLSEQCPKAVVEAMASGLPIVATDVGDVREMLGGDKGGIVITPRDDYAMAQGIGFFLKNQRSAEEKGKFVRERAELLFGLDRVIRDYAALYKEVLIDKLGNNLWE